MFENTSDPQLVIRGQLAGASAVRSKVKQDIDFLKSRIEALEKQPRLNRPVIQTYANMLESRRSVLKWLEHGEDEVPVERTGTG